MVPENPTGVVKSWLCDPHPLDETGATACACASQSREDTTCCHTHGYPRLRSKAELHDELECIQANVLPSVVSKPMVLKLGDAWLMFIKRIVCYKKALF